MGREYFKTFHSYIKSIEPLSDAERGRLFTAMLEYSITGEAPHLSGNEKYVFPTMQVNIDREISGYNDTVEQNRENGKKGGRPPKRKNHSGFIDNPQNQSGFSKSQDKEKEKEKDKDKDKDTNMTPLTPLAPFPGASPELCDAFAAWLSYKRERREAYKATGLQALMSRIQTAAGQYGDHAVAELIRDCMAASWKGIIFDRLKNAPPPSRQQRASWADIAAQMDAEEVYQ